MTALLVCGFLAFLPQLAFTETVSLHGVSFPVDAITPIDAVNVQISVGEETSIVAKDSLSRAVVSLYFSPGGRARRFSSQVLKEFIEKSLAARDIDSASKAVPFYLDAADLDEFAARDFLEELSLSPGAVDVFKNALLLLRSRPDAFPHVRNRGMLGAVLLYAVSRTDPIWVKGNALRWAFLFSESFRSYLVERFTRFITQKQPARTEEVVSIVKEVFGDADGLYKSLTLLNERIQQVINRQPQDPIDTLYPLVEAARQDPLSGATLYPLLAQELHSEAERAIQKGEAGKAIQILSRTDFTRRTPFTHELIRRALPLVRNEDRTVENDRESEMMLTGMSEADAQIKAAYQNLLSRQVMQSLEDRDAVRAEGLFLSLLRVRPDPNPLNDDIRIEEALLFLQMENRDLAFERIGQVRTGITLWDRLKLGLSGLYINRYVAVLFVVIPLVTVFWFLLLELRKLRELRLEAALSRANETPDFESGRYDSDEQTQRIFTQPGLKKAVDPRLTEYDECMRILGLKSDATLKEIKTTYRNVVKHIHPDMRGGDSGKASAQFIEMTQAYDRVLELRKALGKDS